MAPGRRWPLLGLVALAVAFLVIALENLVLAAAFPHLPRLTTDFSAAYLRRELDDVASGPPATVFFGDSVLWGYRVAPQQTAVAILAARGCICRNLAFKSGNPANDYALARLLAAPPRHPRAVIVEVNQAVLNASDAEYKTLHPGIAALAAPFLTPEDRQRLTIPPPAGPLQGRLDTVLASASLLYAMRSDVRETLFGEPAPSPLPHLTPEMFEGTYDLAPLTEDNVGVHYLEATAEALRRARIPMIAFLTPTNHRLLHDYIDNPQYQRNAAYLRVRLRARGARVLDWDDAFPAAQFIDNAHLTPAGQRHLAELLARALDLRAPHAWTNVGLAEGPCAGGPRENGEDPHEASSMARSAVRARLHGCGRCCARTAAEPGVRRRRGAVRGEV